MTTWKRYEHREMHRLLCATHLSAAYKKAETDYQAIFCPYYVPLQGVLGPDWGVIVNPESTRFGRVTFEHDDCGCPGEAPGFMSRHPGAPCQEGDTWDVDWEHVHDEFCDCEDT